MNWFKNSGHDARAVANEILRIAEENDIRLTNMQLLKLVYFAHGWTLATLGHPLVSDDFQAWQHGPVAPSVYFAFRQHGFQPVTTPARSASDMFGGGQPFTAVLTDDERSILEEVVREYGQLPAFHLSELTHEEGTPWWEVRRTGGPYAKIPNEVIKRYFVELDRSLAGSEVDTQVA